jgi:hypothetical protein
MQESIAKVRLDGAVRYGSADGPPPSLFPVSYGSYARRLFTIWPTDIWAKRCPTMTSTSDVSIQHSVAKQAHLIRAKKKI